MGKGTADLSVPNKIRSMDWLKTNGMCVDNLVADKSRIIQAGHGAFATRRIKKGDIISPMPVVQIRREHLEIYDTNDLDNPTEIWYVHVEAGRIVPAADDRRTNWARTGLRERKFFTIMCWAIRKAACCCTPMLRLLIMSIITLPSSMPNSVGQSTQVTKQNG